MGSIPRKGGGPTSQEETTREGLRRNQAEKYVWREGDMEWETTSEQEEESREVESGHPEVGREPRYFTHYWTERMCASLAATGSEGELLDHTAGNRLRSKGIGPGDHVYVVSLSKGRLVLVAKLELERVADRHEAAEILAISPEDLWDAEDHLIASSATPMTFHRLVPLETTERLRFLT